MMCGDRGTTKSFSLFEILFIVLTIGGFVANATVENYFLVKLKDGTPVDAFVIAKESHFKLVKQVRGFRNLFLFEKIYTTSETSKRSNIDWQPLEKDQRVVWASQQRALKRDKRDYFVLSLSDYFDDRNYFKQYNKSYRRKYTPPFNDELWEKQWYMQKSINKTGATTLDLNVLPVYARGITGRGVRVAVLDDGLEYDHEDLIANYDPEISWDCNNDLPDPHPNYRDMSNRHGTRCAGEIAMVANNKKCGVGIAYNSRIGGIKLLGGQVYDLIEGMALGFAHDKVDIYSSSWGPTDNGKTLERPGIFASQAIERGINEGRNGLGSIYVWASGNGGARFDNCNCDGYAASIYTITIGSVTQQADVPWYSEGCTSIMAVTHSSGAMDDQMIATTDLGNQCTVKHTGTSASAPLAAGIIALGLEANPFLTWRDVQHLIVRTSEYVPLRKNYGWQKNGAGRQYHTHLGFGVMNAEAFVSAAIKWEMAPKQFFEQILGYPDPKTPHKLLNSTYVFQNASKINFIYQNGIVKFLEHVEIVVDIQSKRRGNLEMFLKSPSGMRVPILERRLRDNSSDGFTNWTFMSVATWSENPYGIWTLEVYERSTKSGPIFVNKCILILYGTKTDPQNNYYKSKYYPIK